VSESISTDNSSESNSIILPLLPPSQIFDTTPNISQDNPRTNLESFISNSGSNSSETPSIPSSLEGLSLISRNYQDSLSSLDELRTLLENLSSQPPPELPDLPENIPLLSSLLSDETKLFIFQYSAFTELFAYLKNQGFR
jgi:hypothetical protein